MEQVKDYNDLRVQVLWQVLVDLKANLEMSFPQVGSAMACSMGMVENALHEIDDQEHQDILAGRGPISHLSQVLGLGKDRFMNLLEQYDSDYQLTYRDIERFLREHVHSGHTEFTEGGYFTLGEMSEDLPWWHERGGDYQTGIFRDHNKFHFLLTFTSNPVAVHSIHIPLSIKGHLRGNDGDISIKTTHFGESREFNHTHYEVVDSQEFRYKLMGLLEKLGYEPPPVIPEDKVLDRLREVITHFDKGTENYSEVLRRWSMVSVGNLTAKVIVPENGTLTFWVRGPNWHHEGPTSWNDLNPTQQNKFWENLFNEPYE